MGDQDDRDLNERIAALEADIQSIKARNARVEMDKTWEQSIFRIAFILLFTYLVTTLVFWLIQVPNPWLNALIPTTAYLLSTLSLPLVKRWWLGHRSP